MTDTDPRARIAAELRARRRFVITSHVRPDADAIGSELAMAFALEALGRTVRVVNLDPPPPSMRDFPGVDRIEVTDRIEDPGEAVIVMECGNLARTGVAGLDPGFVVNIDHHPGNTNFGALNWIDLGAAACGQMVFDLVDALGVPLSYEIAVHVYAAILTDTGSFHYSAISTHTFDVCRRCMDAGVDPPAVARRLYDSNTLGRVKLFGAVLNAMELAADGRIAILSVDKALLAACGASLDDTDGLINQPLTVQTIQAVVFFKEHAPGDWRVSLRSKGAIDVSAVAGRFGGGGHRNASGCSAEGRLADLQARFAASILEQMDPARRDTAPVG